MPIAAGTGHVEAGEWFNTFQNLIAEGKTLALATLGLVAIVMVLRAAHTSKGAIVSIVMAGIAAAVAIWLATNSDNNAKRTGTEITGSPAAGQQLRTGAHQWIG